MGTLSLEFCLELCALRSALATFQYLQNNVVLLHLGVTRGYKDGLQPESLADGNWLVKQNQPVSKIETLSDTNLRSLYES